MPPQRQLYLTISRSPKSSVARAYRLLEGFQAIPDVIYDDAHYRSLKEIFSYSE